MNDKQIPDTTRPIRSYVRRQGRFTPAQRQAFERYWPSWGLVSNAEILDLRAMFPDANRFVFEVGFGMGQTLAELARNEPNTVFIGAEVHRPGVGKLLSLIDTQKLGNIRIFAEDATVVLEQSIADGALDSVLLFFPDPWPKARHHKRRLIQPSFVQLVRAKLKAEGFFHLATDWQDYAEHMLAVLGEAEGFTNISGTGQYAPRPHSRPETKFERRGVKLGHGVWDLLFQKTG